jgi:predicted enzyme related to lactoylglutathione lyase
MPPVVHFEIPATILERARYFYSRVFGWECTKLDDADYYVVRAREKGIGIDGGIILRKTKEQQPVNYVKVERIDDAITKIEQYGGMLIVNKTAVPKTGWFAVFRDTENNVMGVWQDDVNAGMTPPEERFV